MKYELVEVKYIDMYHFQMYEGKFRALEQAENGHDETFIYANVSNFDSHTFEESAVRIYAHSYENLYSAEDYELVNLYSDELCEYLKAVILENIGNEALAKKRVPTRINKECLESIPLMENLLIVPDKTPEQIAPGLVDAMGKELAAGLVEYNALVRQLAENPAIDLADTTQIKAELERELPAWDENDWKMLLHLVRVLRNRQNSEILQ